MTLQSSLGIAKPHRSPKFEDLQLARVTSAVDFDKLARIEVVLLNQGQPSPIWIINNIDRKPIEGDFVLVGYINGRKDMPYLAGFYKNKSYTTNFIHVDKDKIRVQLPVLEVGVAGGKAIKDVEGHLLDESRLSERAYMELTPTQAVMSFPVGDQTARTELTPAQASVSFPVGNQVARMELTPTQAIVSFPLGNQTAHININTSGIEISHPTGDITVISRAELSDRRVTTL